MLRTEIINTLAKKINAKDYLEIGICRGANMARINIENKIGVDPKPYGGMGRENVTHRMTSDAFFEENYKKFDIIFIDGYHESSQVKKDIFNSLSFLNDGGYIVCHDMNPKSKNMQDNPPENHGDCWKTWVKLRQAREDLNMFVVDTDCGCGVISKAGPRHEGRWTSSLRLNNINEELTYEGLKENRKEWLNLISVEEFQAENKDYLCFLKEGDMKSKVAWRWLERQIRMEELEELRKDKESGKK